MDVGCYNRERFSQPTQDSARWTVPGPHNSGGEEGRSAFFSSRSGQRSQVLTCISWGCECLVGTLLVFAELRFVLCSGTWARCHDKQKGQPDFLCEDSHASGFLPKSSSGLGFPGVVSRSGISKLGPEVY